MTNEISSGKASSVMTLDFIRGPSFRAQQSGDPESSGSDTFLDSGLRRNDEKRGLRRNDVKRGLRRNDVKGGFRYNDEKNLNIK
jgi:hypothetical protein